MWQSGKLRNYLYEVAGLKKGTTLSFAKNTKDMKSVLESTKLKKNFHKSRNVERIAAFKGKENEIMCIFRHIRNALAHGRIAIYNDSGEIYFVLEDGKRKNEKLEVRSRMVLKESTLIEWKRTIESGKIPDKEE